MSCSATPSGQCSLSWSLAELERRVATAWCSHVLIFVDCWISAQICRNSAFAHANSSLSPSSRVTSLKTIIFHQTIRYLKRKLFLREFCSAAFTTASFQEIYDAHVRLSFAERSFVFLNRLFCRNVVLGFCGTFLSRFPSFSVARKRI